MRARERGAALHMSLDIEGDCTRTRLSGRITSYVGVAEHNHVDSVSALHSCTVAMMLSVRRRRSGRIYQDHEAHTPLVTKHQSMPDKNVRLPGRRRIPAVYDHFPPAHFQSRLHVIESVDVDGACANCHLNGYPKACSLEHAFQIQL
jgi:hypothetical protein